MKNRLILLTISSLLLACNEQEKQVNLVTEDTIYTTDIKQISGTNTVTDFEARLFDLSGKEITELSQMMPHTTYSLVVESSAPAHFRIRTSSGFTILDSPASRFTHLGKQVGRHLSTTSTFTIKTNDDAGSGIFACIVPLYLEKGKVVRERPKNFLLPVTQNNSTL